MLPYVDRLDAVYQVSQWYLLANCTMTKLSVAIRSSCIRDRSNNSASNGCLNRTSDKSERLRHLVEPRNYTFLVPRAVGGPMDGPGKGPSFQSSRPPSSGPRNPQARRTSLNDIDGDASWIVLKMPSSESAMFSTGVIGLAAARVSKLGDLDPLRSFLKIYMGVREPKWAHSNARPVSEGPGLFLGDQLFHPTQGISVSANKVISAISLLQIY